MTRTLTFGLGTDTATGAPSDEAQRFALLVNLFIGGGNLLHFNPASGPTSRSRDERAKEARIVRAYEAVSHEVGTPVGGRTLNDQGGALVLDQKCFELLVKYLEAAPAGTGDSARIDDLLDWVNAAPQDRTDP